MNTKLLYILICSLFLFACEEEITLEMPNNEAKIVVEGFIQPHFPIVLQLTTSKGYFDEITENELMDVFISDVTDIKVIRNSDNAVVSLFFVPLDSLGNIGLYSDLENFNPEFARENESYTLEIIYNGDTITSTTTIPVAESETELMIDSVWYVEDELFPGFGDFYFSYNDADTMGNNIMLEAKRIYHYDFENEKNTPDFRFTKALWGAVRNDFEGFNGVKNFVSYFDRGEDNIFGNAHGIKRNGDFGNFQASQKDTAEIWQPADEVIIRFSQINEASFIFWRDTEYQEQMNGNPFAEPINLSHNINGGFGIWEGKGAIYFKVMAQKDTTFTERFKPTTPEEIISVIY